MSCVCLPLGHYELSLLQWREKSFICSRLFQLFFLGFVLLLVKPETTEVSAPLSDEVTTKVDKKKWWHDFCLWNWIVNVWPKCTIVSIHQSLWIPVFQFLYLFLYFVLFVAYENRERLPERDHRWAALCSGPRGTTLHRYNEYMHRWIHADVLIYQCTETA